MFNNPGARIKGLAKTLFWIEIVSIIIGLIATEMIEEIGAAIVILIVGVGAAYLTSLFVYAFGELVETNTQIKDSNESIVKLLCEQQSAPTAVPAASAATPGKPAAAQAAFQTFADGSWQCTCGRKNMSYVSTCSCGKNKRDLQ